MSFFEKKNPDATITSLVFRTATVAIIMIVFALWRDSFNSLGVIPVSLSITLGVLWVAAIEWQGLPSDSSKDDTGKWSTTTTVIVAALILMGIIWELCRRIF